jgi:foldase protein PrsA
MHTRLPYPVAIALACLLCLVAPLRAETLITVNGEDVTEQEFGDAMIRTYGVYFIDQLIDQTLIEQEAERRGITITAEELIDHQELLVELALRKNIQRMRVGRKEFHALMEEHGTSPTALRSALQDTLSPVETRTRLLAQKLLEPELDLGEEALRSYWARTRGPRFSAAHILVREKQDARRILAELQRDPRLWKQMLLARSLDRRSLAFSGRMPLVPADSELGRALADMRPGQMKLRTTEGLWQILRFVNTVPGTGEKLQDVREEVRAELAAELTRDHLYDLLHHLHARATVTLNMSPDPAERALLGEQNAAFVNGRPLTTATLRNALLEVYGASLLPRYVDRLLVFQEARRLGVSVTDREVEQRRREIAEQLMTARAAQRGIGESELDEMFSELPELADELKRRVSMAQVPTEDVRATLLAEKLVRDDVRVTEADREQVAREFRGERVIVRELEAPTATAAQGLYDSLRRGASFDELALTGEQPGLWTQQSLGVAVTARHPYWDEAKDLEPGEISRIFEHNGKYRIIKALARISAGEQDPEELREAIEREAFLRKARRRIHALLLALGTRAKIETPEPSTTKPQE